MPLGRLPHTYLPFVCFIAFIIQSAMVLHQHFTKSSGQEFLKSWFMKCNEKQIGLSAAIPCRKGVFLSTALPADWIYWKLLFCNPVVNFLLMFPSYFEMSRPPFQPRQTHFYDSHESIASRFGKKVLTKHNDRVYSENILSDNKIPRGRMTKL